MIEDKFALKYGLTDGARSGLFNLQFGVYGDHQGVMRDIEVYLDDVRIGVPTTIPATCPDLVVRASSSAISFSIGGSATSITGTVVTGRWNVVRLDPTTHLPLGGIIAMTDSEFVTYINGLSYGSLLMVGHTGPITCAVCAPTAQPTGSPSVIPSLAPSVCPSSRPSVSPSFAPSCCPSTAPSVSPSLSPSGRPSVVPSTQPSVCPSVSPSLAPSAGVSSSPSVSPSFVPSFCPSRAPSVSPSVCPSGSPSMRPSFSPSVVPSVRPSLSPSMQPSARPSVCPSVSPSVAPSACPNTCDSALALIGGYAITQLFNPSESISMAGIGQVGLNGGTMPFTVTLWSENVPAVSRSYIGCHSSTTSLGENFHSVTNIGNPLLANNLTFYYPELSSLGDLGCFVRGNEANIFLSGFDTGFTTTPASCALACRDSGFPFARIYRSECACGDAVGRATTVSDRTHPVSDNRQISPDYCLILSQRESWWTSGCRGDWSQYCSVSTYNMWFRARSSEPFGTSVATITCVNALSVTSCNQALDRSYSTVYQSTNFVAGQNYTLTVDLRAEYSIDNVRLHSSTFNLVSYELRCGRLVSTSIVYTSFGVVRNANQNNNDPTINSIDARG
jgi:hypothetical protein